MTVAYLDTSAALKLVVEESESQALTIELRLVDLTGAT